MFSGFCISMRWIAVISEAIKGNKTVNTIVEWGQDPGILLGFCIIFCAFVLVVALYYIYDTIYKKFMSKPYEAVVKDFLKFAEKKKLDENHKEKLIQLLKQAQENEELLNILKNQLFDIKINQQRSKFIFSTIIDKLYNHFPPKN